MDFNLTEAQEAYRLQIRQWMTQHAPEYRKRMTQIGAGGASQAALREVYQEWQSLRQQAGYTCVMWPKRYGGSEKGPVEHFLVTREIDAVRVVPNINVIGFGMCLPVILHAGNEAQRQRYLSPAVRGEEVWCQLFSEPGAGSDLAGLQTAATLEGDQWRIRGQKIWTSYAQYADYGLLIARSDSTTQRHRGLTMFVVDMKAPGVTVRPIVFNNGSRVYNEVFFEDARIPAENVVGEVGGGWKVAIDTLMFERGTSNIHVLFRPLIDRVLDDARRRLRHAPPTLENQHARWQIARLLTRLQIMELQGLRVLFGAQSGAPPGAEGSLVKLDWSETNMDAQALAMTLAGPLGLLSQPATPSEDAADGAFSQEWLRSFGNTIEAGSSEILRNILAERVLGLPKDAARA